MTTQEIQILVAESFADWNDGYDAHKAWIEKHIGRKLTGEEEGRLWKVINS